VLQKLQKVHNTAELNNPAQLILFPPFLLLKPPLSASVKSSPELTRGVELWLLCRAWEAYRCWLGLMGATLVLVGPQGLDVWYWYGATPTSELGKKPQQ
ncbi:hypothetical protein CRG98_039085, partial [Punica granatum]